MKFLFVRMRAIQIGLLAVWAVSASICAAQEPVLQRPGENPLPVGVEKPAKIIVVDDLSYAPFSFIDANGNASGITIDIWNLWSKKTGISVEFQLKVWDTALAEVRDGEADVVGGLFRTPNREELYDFTDSFYQITTGVFFHRDIHGIRGLQDLNGFHIGVVKGDSSEEFLLESNPSVQLVEYPGADYLVKAALQGAIKVFVLDSHSARFYLAKYDSREDFREAVNPLFVNKQYAAVRKGNYPLLAVLDDGFNRISRGEIQEIVDAWTGNSLFSKIPWKIVGGALFLVASAFGMMFLWNLQLKRQIAKAMSDLLRSNEDLLRSEWNYREIFDSTSEMIFIHDAENGIILDANRAAVEMCGYAKESLLGQSVALICENIPPFTGEEALRWIQRARPEGFSVIEWKFKRSNGESFWTEVSLRSFHSGSDNRVIAVIRDISERKLAEEALRESEAKYRLILDHSSDLIWNLDIHGIFTYVSPSWKRMTGYEPSSILGQSFQPLVHPDDLSICLAYLHNVIQTKEIPKSQEYRVRHADGTWHWHIARGTPVIDSKGECVSMVGVSRDITEQKQSEEAVRESERTLQSLFSAVPTGVGMLKDRFFYKVNNELCRITGYTEEELLGHTTRMLYPDEESFISVGRQLYEQLEREGLSMIEAKLQHKNGATIDVFLCLSPIDPTDWTKGICSTVLDITKRKRAEEELLREQLLMKKLLDSLPGIFYLYTYPELRLVRWNKNHETLLGFEHDELLNRDIMEWHVPEAKEAVRQAVDLVMEKGINMIESPLLAKDGHTIPFLMTGVRLELPGQLYLMGVGIDITELKQAEESREKLQIQLVQSQKMESVGRLAGGVAHDFNNMLGVILGHTEMALMKINPDHRIHSDLKEIEKAAQRSADLTRQLLAFARKQTVTPVILNLNEAIEGMLKMLRRIIGEDIDLAWIPGLGTWPIKIDPSQIDQIMANLCVNARDAIAGIGKVTIETKNTAFDEAYCTDRIGYAPGEYVMLAVSDTGCGVDKAIQEKIFEPFFTTKGVGEGTGLGLATVYGILKQNDGFINVYSEPGKGTTFKIYLPRFVGDTVEIHNVREGAILRGSETVLLVEDEPLILSMGKSMLEALGYRVLAANSPGEAFRLAEEYADEIHLLLTDVIMPEMNGRDLANRLLSLYPHLKQLFMSGYTANVIAHHNILEDGIMFLQKPFSMRSLSAKIREALES